MTEQVTIGERIQEIADLHSLPQDEWLAITAGLGEIVKGRCGCVVCRAWRGDPEARADVIAAMMLGCDFHGIEKTAHNGKPWVSFHKRVQFDI